MSIPKPAIGAPCNGCGLCCLAEVCSAGSFTLGLVDAYGQRASGPCPALLPQTDGSFACGLVLRPKDYAPGKGASHDLRQAAALMIGAGAGCDEAAGPEDVDAITEMQTRYLSLHGREKLQRAVRTWFGI